MRNFILGTDWCEDCDDAVAVRVLCRMIKAKKINLCGIAINACTDVSVTSLDGFLVKEGCDGIPIGIDTEATYFNNGLYQPRLSKYAKNYKSNADAENALRLYRRILSEADEPIEIIEIGFLQVIGDLLESKPDDISELSGLELVKQKVAKFWIMAGRWDTDGGHEYNFDKTPRSRYGGHTLCEKSPVPITFLGFEVGEPVISGENLKEGDHLYDVLCDYWGTHKGRSSWDPLTALLAVIGDEKEAGYDCVCGTASVDEDTGANHFKVCDNGLHKYVVKTKSDAFYTDMVNRIIE